MPKYSNIFNLRCWSIYAVLSLIIIIPFSYTQQECDENFSELSLANLERVFTASIGGGPAQAHNSLMSFVLSCYPLGLKLTQQQGEICAQVEGILISLAYHLDGQEPYEETLQKGTMMGFAFHIVEILQDAKLYEKKVQKEQKEIQEIAWITLSVALMYGDPDGFRLEADKTQLCPEETTNITATLNCGECPMKVGFVTFEITEGPGEISPKETYINKDGIATAVFRAKEEGPTIITVHYLHESSGIEKQIQLETLSCQYFLDYHLQCNFLDMIKVNLSLEAVPSNPEDVKTHDYFVEWKGKLKAEAGWGYGIMFFRGDMDITLNLNGVAEDAKKAPSGNLNFSGSAVLNSGSLDDSTMELAMNLAPLFSHLPPLGSSSGVEITQKTEEIKGLLSLMKSMIDQRIGKPMNIEGEIWDMSLDGAKLRFKIEKGQIPPIPAGVSAFLDNLNEKYETLSPEEKEKADELSKKIKKRLEKQLGGEEEETEEEEQKGEEEDFWTGEMTPEEEGAIYLLVKGICPVFDRHVEIKTVSTVIPKR